MGHYSSQRGRYGVEPILAETRLHWATVAPPLAAAACFAVPGIAVIIASYLTEFTGIRALGIGLIILGILLVVFGVAYRFSGRVLVTRTHLILVRGLLLRTTLDVPFYEIERIWIDESEIAQKIGYGTLVIRSRNGAEARVETIADPLTLFAAAQRALDASERGRTTAA